MTELLQLSDEQRRTIFNQVGFLEGLSPEVVEKDWWVTLTLKAVFETKYAPHLLFKGGTSLSKCWKLIKRFSEDIDLAIDREYLGFAGDLSNKQIHNLKKTACSFTSNDLKSAIEERLLQLDVPVNMITLEAEPVPDTFPDKDPQVLRLIYPSLYEPIDYIPAIVKIEVSGRSLKEPWSECFIQSFVSDHLPGQQFSGKPFKVFAVEAKRTFLEKIFLLHEEFLKLEDIRHLRMSRHLHDLIKLMDTIHGWEAITDTALYASIIIHRSKYNKLKAVDYNTHAVATINFIPPAAIRDEYAKDYEIMRERMINEDAIKFDELINRLKELSERLRSPVDFKSIIDSAVKNDPKNSSNPNFMIEGSTIIIPVIYPSITDSLNGNHSQYEVTFIRENGGLIFKTLRKLKP